MKIKEIEYSLSKKIQIKEYEPVGFFVAAKAEIVEGDDIKEAYKELHKVVHEQMKEDVNRVANVVENIVEDAYVDEIEKIKTLKELQDYYKKNKDKHKSVDFNRCIANKKKEL